MNTLSWNANPETDIAGYNVYRQIDAGPDVKINTALVLTPTYIDHDTAIPGTYKYTVTAVNTAGLESLPSNVADKVVVPVPPSAPTGLVVS